MRCWFAAGLLLVSSTWMCLGPVAPAQAATEGTAKPSSVFPRSPIFPKFSAENAITEEGISAEDLLALQLGDVLVEKRPIPHGLQGTHVAAMTMVEGSVEAIMNVVLDCLEQPTFVPNLKECRNIYASYADPATATRFQQYQKLTLGFGFLRKEIQYVNNMFVIKPYVSAWQLAEGDLARSEGYWRIIPFAADRQILVYNVYHEPGMAVPTWVRDVLVKSDLPRTLKAFRDRVEARPSPNK